MNLLQRWKHMIRCLLFIWTPEDEFFYIGGAEVLPPPLEKEEERRCLEALILEEQGRQVVIQLQRDAVENTVGRIRNEEGGEGKQKRNERVTLSLAVEDSRKPLSRDTDIRKAEDTRQQPFKAAGVMTADDARKRLISHNLRLVVYLAKRFENTGINVEDLISIGTIGLIKGINTFNPMKNIKLATYASRCIENEILMYLRRSSKNRLEVSIDEPLNVDWDGNELLLSDILGTEEDVISRDMENEAELGLLRNALAILNDREKEIVFLRYGLDRPDGREMTQKEVADQLGISQSYISRLEKKIMLRLRKEIEKYE